MRFRLDAAAGVSLQVWKSQCVSAVNIKILIIAKRYLSYTATFLACHSPPHFLFTSTPFSKPGRERMNGGKSWCTPSLPNSMGVRRTWTGPTKTHAHIKERCSLTWIISPLMFCRLVLSVVSTMKMCGSSTYDTYNKVCPAKRTKKYTLSWDISLCRYFKCISSRQLFLHWSEHPTPGHNWGFIIINCFSYLSWPGHRLTLLLVVIFLHRVWFEAGECVWSNEKINN